MLKTILSRLALPLGFILLFISIWVFFQKINELSHSHVAQAKVVGFILRGDSSFAAVSYHDAGGSPVQSTVPSWTTLGAGNGDSISLLVDDRAPEHVQVYSLFFYWFSLLIWAALTIICLTVGYRANPNFLSSILSLLKPAPATTYQRGPQKSSHSNSPRTKNMSAAQVAAGLPSDQRLFGMLQPLIDDQSISDIVAASYQDFTIIKNGKVISCDIEFPNQEAYENFVERVLFKAGVSYSVSKPIVDGMIGPHVRIHAVNPVLCEHGPYLTIRISRFPIISSDDLVRSGVAPRPILRYLQCMVTAGHTTLIAGEVGCGKTTLLRALASGVAHDESILVIEDTPEIQIDHPHVRYIRTREANIAGFGEILLDQCIKASMRMAMNRIILGEIRDPQAAEAFIDVCVSGHPGLCTIHSRSANDAFNRLELLLARREVGANRQALREQIATAAHVIVYMRYCKKTNQRRIFEVKEIKFGDDGVLHQQTIFQYEVFDGLPGWRAEARESYYPDALSDKKGPLSLHSLPAVFGMELS